MVLRKLFLKTIGSVKSFFSNGYQKLPKSPTCNPYNACLSNANLHTSSIRDNERFHDFSNRWNESEGAAKKKMRLFPSSPSNSSKQQEKKQPLGGDFSENSNLKQLKRRNYAEIRKIREDDDGDGWVKGSRIIHRQYAVVEKLRELKMMGDSDANHAAEMEEFLHYYSRLTLPAYIDIVDKFFMEVWSEFFASNVSKNGQKRGKVDGETRVGGQRIKRTPLRIIQR